MDLHIIPITMAMTNCPIIDKNGNLDKYLATNAMTNVIPIPFKKAIVSSCLERLPIAVLNYVTPFNYWYLYFIKNATISKIHIND
jgi:hypothetical protein